MDQIIGGGLVDCNLPGVVGMIPFKLSEHGTPTVLQMMSAGYLCWQAYGLPLTLNGLVARTKTSAQKLMTELVRLGSLALFSSSAPSELESFVSDPRLLYLERLEPVLISQTANLRSLASVVATLAPSSSSSVSLAVAQTPKG